MPKSRRKVAASKAKSHGVVKDFVKKKERLGRKSQAANATNVSVHSRQVHLPAPTAFDASAEVASKSGLSFDQLIVRCTHYSAGKRMAALNGLARAFAVDDAAASTHVRADHNRVLRIALTALHDDAATVRVAANGVLAAVLSHSPSVSAFAPLLSARLIACLSHIRQHVQLSGARALRAVFCDAGIDPRDVFGENMHTLLAAVADVLDTVKTPKNKNIVLDALANVLAQPAEPVQDEGSSFSSAHTSVFYYHRSNVSSSGQTQKGGSMSSALAERPEILNDLAKRVVDVIMELLPIHETKRDPAAVGLLLSASRALYCLLSVFRLSDTTSKIVLRCLQKWSKERNRHQDRGDVHSAHNFLAASAICIDEIDLASAYVSSVLSHGHSGVPKTENGPGKAVHLSVECLALKILQSCQDATKATSRERVLTSWMTQFLSSVRSKKPCISAASTSILSCVIGDFLSCVKEGKWQMPELEEIGWKILILLPQAISEVSTSSADSKTSRKDGGQHFLGVALVQLARASRLCCRMQSEKMLELRKAAEDFLLAPKLLERLHEDMVGELVAVLFYTKVFATREAIRTVVQAFCVGTLVSLDFALRLLIVLEASLLTMEHEQEKLLLELYTAASLIISEGKRLPGLEASRQRLSKDVDSIARRICSRSRLIE